MDILRWKLLGRNPYRSQYRHERRTLVRVDWERVRAFEGLSLTFIKHATLLIRDRQGCLLVDPIFGGLGWPIRDFNPLGFDLGAMPVPDTILITHGHFDHLDLPSLKPFAGRARLVTPLGYASTLKVLGQVRHTELDWFETVNANGSEITLLPCDHWSMRNPLKGPNHSLWGSYLIRTAGGVVIYISGDTAFFNHFPELGLRYDIDLAVFNLGAYAPGWFMQQAHMNPAEVLRAFGELKARYFTIVHWGTFRLGDEPVFLPPMDLKALLARQDLTHGYLPLEHGQSLWWPDSTGTPNLSP